jgi:Ser/Thr protein kinase RdoA (MazF antagonist)
MTDPRLRPVLDCFAAAQGAVHVLPLAGAGGFSGSQLWKVAAPAGEYCLRRWPEETTAERLAFIHACQRHWRGSGLAFIPVPMDSSTGRTFVEHQGHLWELATWMPGKADYRDHPSPARLAAAMQALARIHEAAATMTGQSRVATSPGLAARLKQLRELRDGGIERIAAAVVSRPLAWDKFARQICDKFRQFALLVEPRLADAVTISGPLFPCLRDVWHNHVLFTGDDVTGIIDFGAARVESPAGDIARLVGSLVGDDQRGWDAALAAYDASRPLGARQRQLIRAFDASNVLLSGINWLSWLYLEQREFEDAAAVTRRLAEISARLERIPTIRT